MGEGKGEVEEAESAGVEAHVRKQGTKKEHQADDGGTAALPQPLQPLGLSRPPERGLATRSFPPPSRRHIPAQLSFLRLWIRGHKTGPGTVKT